MEKRFRWESGFTMSANRNRIVELVKDYRHPETGEIINKDRLDVGGLGKARFILRPAAPSATSTPSPASSAT